jgi:hypothetical protein
VLIFLLQAASAGFTPTFQATIPDILPDEKDYTRALSLSRLEARDPTWCDVSRKHRTKTALNTA